MEAAQAVGQRGRLRAAVLALTYPACWILDEDGAPVARLTAAGGHLVASLCGVELGELQPSAGGLFAPEREELPDGHLALRGWVRAGCALLGRVETVTEVSKSTLDEYTGRYRVDGKLVTKLPPGTKSRATVHEPDLRRSLATKLRTVAVGQVTGVDRVPVDELARAWSRSRKDVDQCPRFRGDAAEATS